MITFNHIAKTYSGDTRAVRDLTMEIATGETLVLLGSSGCGKTTTLKMINRLVEPTGGRITVGGRDIHRDMDKIALRRSIGYVFQEIGLFSHMTVRRNVEVIPRLMGWDRPRRRKRAEELMESVGLEPGKYAARYPEELSGGQQQRVGVARSLAADPDYLLMDEPFGALDAVTRDELQEELISLKTRMRKTIVFVTHDILEAVRIGDRIAVLHDGVLQQVDTAGELIRDPATDFVRRMFDKPRRELEQFRELG